MAKKRTTSGTEATPKKAAGGAKKAAAPKGAKTAKAAGGAALKKKAAPVKITDKQRELLAKIQGAGELGYKPEKAEGRGLNGLKEKKLVKGVRNKDTKEVHAMLTKAGEKALAPPKA